ncbi:GNAT family N-acetyltransferase [Saccharibacillus sp. JS10]|uniref:GNAT family N-acetyltransferase n=1 Tax=Saccharibacillus sp. JS10 TaxID=2950552 RepID=UPI00210C3F7B|nr:GNAT family N-acetyltransferase [Saccharibacillus sp. JS10]MCQ4087381.1 GNAT family N-acetyltransferase [Saccharibacillus sp. JS10]
MEYTRVNDIADPLFAGLHQLMSDIFPREEVLAFDLWKEPLEDPGIRVFVAVHEGKVVGATEYRYYPQDDIAMTDFTIIGQPGLGIGPFLANHREADLRKLAAEAGGSLKGMFAEIYDPYQSNDHEFGGVKPMDPFVRREVLAHLGYRRLNFSYVHPSWQGDGEAVDGLDLCFLPYQEISTLEGAFIAKFLLTYYSVLEPKPAQWIEMVENLQARPAVELLPL